MCACSRRVSQIGALKHEGHKPMNNAELKASYDQNGFVIIRQLLRPDGFAELQQQLERYIRDVVPTLPDTHAFYDDRSKPETLKQMQHMTQDAYFGEYQSHLTWKNVAEALVGEEVN